MGINGSIDPVGDGMFYFIVRVGDDQSQHETLPDYSKIREGYTLVFARLAYCIKPVHYLFSAKGCTIP